MQIRVGEMKKDILGKVKEKAGKQVLESLQVSVRYFSPKTNFPYLIESGKFQEIFDDIVPEKIRTNMCSIEVHFMVGEKQVMIVTSSPQT